jgi:AAA ATPase domain
MVDRCPGQGRLASLFGRRTESAALDGMIAAVREGESCTLVLRGETGFGKTALVQYARVALVAPRPAIAPARRPRHGRDGQDVNPPRADQR